MSRTAARGFTLVELLVAVTIGLLLTVLISQVFVGSKRTYAATDDLSRMQENMRYAHDLLGRAVRMASYTASPANYQISFEGYQGAFDAPSLALEGKDGPTATAPDTLTVRYQGAADGTTTDCLGNVVPAGAISTNIFTVEPVANVPSLVCRIVAGANPTVLVPDVENMQVLYGEETDGDFNVDHYVKQAEVVNFNAVFSVRVALLFRTAGTNLRPTADTTQYDLLGVKPAYVDPKRIRKVMTVTYAIRNRTP